MKKYIINITVMGLGVALGIFVSSKLNILTNVNSEVIKLDVGNSTNKTDVDNVEKIEDELVLVESVYDGFEIDLRYATKDNITKKILYPEQLCYLQKNTLEKLIQVNEELRLKGYKIKIWDAYRPLSVQKKLWAAYPNANYIANPFSKGSNHNRGAAVDITLVDLYGKPVPMPTGFDEFGPKAHRGYKASAEAIKNVDMLTEMMEKYGFKKINTEWWHFDDVDCNKFPVRDHSFRDLLKK